MGNTNTPRPNVATGAFMGFVTMMLGLLLTALQTNPSTLEGWLVAMQPVVGFVIAYFAPAYTKAWAALIGAGLVPFILLIVDLANRLIGHNCRYGAGPPTPGPPTLGAPVVGLV